MDHSPRSHYDVGSLMTSPEHSVRLSHVPLLEKAMNSSVMMDHFWPDSSLKRRVHISRYIDLDVNSWIVLIDLQLFPQSASVMWLVQELFGRLEY